MEITFNLDKLRGIDFIRPLDWKSLEKLHNDVNRENWEMFFRPSELEKVFTSTLKITSRDLREFLDDVFGISMSVDSTNNRNQLNAIIKKYAPTKRGHRTILNYYQFRDLILSDDFNRFVLRKQDESKSNNKRLMYEELMYLQVNKFKESNLYQEQKKKDTIYYASALSLVEGFDQVLKQYYSMFLDLWHIQQVYYRYIEATAETKQMLDIISYRFRQKSPLVYKFDSRDDVYNTDKNQIIEWFLRDVERWANNEIK